MGCNRKLEYNGDKLQSIRVEFQTIHGGYNKCVSRGFIVIVK